jgi:TP901 family phage tail tape measure protein
MTDLNLRYQLFGEDKTASSSLKNVGKAADDVGTRVKNSMVKIGEGVGVAVAATVALSVHNAMAMQESDAKIQGSAQLTAKAATAIGDAFLNTAGKSTFSGKEMADSFGPVAGVIQEVAGHTLTAADSMTVMNAATMLAEATGNALGATTGDLAAVMQSYGIKIGGAAAASNILFNASRLTNVPLDTLATTVDKLHGKLGIAAPTLTDVSGLMVDLANHGVAGSKGLMVVNTGLTTLMGGSKATTAELKDLGVHIFDSSGKFVGMAGVLTQLTPKLKDMTQQQQLAAEKALFGAGASKALNTTILAGVTGFTNSTTAVTKHGAAEDAAKAKAATLQGQIKTLTAAFTDITTLIGQKLIPVITSDALWLDKNRVATAFLVGTVGLFIVACTAMTVAIKLNQLATTLASAGKILFSAATGGATVAGVAETVALIAMTAAEVDGNIATKLLTGAQLLMNAAWEANPIGIVILLVTALIGVIVLIATKTTWFQTIWQYATSSMSTAWNWMWKHGVAPVISWIINGFANITTGIGWFLTALSHIPGFGWALDAAKSMDAAATKARALANQINGIPPHKSVGVDVQFSMGTSTPVSGAPNNLFTVGGKAAGGPITGGTAGKDSVLTALMPQEYVIRSDGSNLPDALAYYGIHGMANGGPVSLLPPSLGTRMSEASQAFLNSLTVSSSAFTGGSGGGGGNAANKAIMQAMATSVFGWGSQLGALDYLMMRESGYNNLAQNPGSTAFGMGQFLDSTWASYGPKTTNPYLQSLYTEEYIKGTYVDPNGAAAHERAFNWYANGTASAMPGLAWVGENGPELLNMRGGESVTPMRSLVAGRGAGGGSGASGGDIHIHVNGQVYGSTRDMANVVLSELQRAKGQGVRLNLA